MTRLDATNIFSSLRNNIVNLISKNTINPSTNKKFSEKENIYDRQPDLKNFNFENFPYIIVEHPEIDISDPRDFATLDTKTKEYVWNLDITVHATDRALSANKNSKGSEYTRNIANQLIEMFDNPEVKKHLREKGFYLSVPNLSSVSPVATISKSLVYEFSISFEVRNKTKLESSKTYNF